MEMKGTKQCSVTSICEGSDDKPWRVAKILIAISQGGVDHASDEVLLLPVVTQLTQPLKIHFTCHLYKCT